jgi:hypothetical protein
MTRDELIVTFCRLRAYRRDAVVELMAYASKLPRWQRDGFKRDLQAIAAIYAELRPTRTPVERPPAEDRKSRLTNAERAAWRRYSKDYPGRLSSHIRAR